MDKIHNLKSGYIIIGSLCNAYIQSYIINSFIMSLAFFLEADSRPEKENIYDNSAGGFAVNNDIITIRSMSFIGDDKYTQAGGYMEQKNNMPGMGNMGNMSHKSNEKSDDISKRDEQKKDKTAVALSYNPADDAAPKVIASGKGFVAEKIIQKAMEAAVPIHKDERLAHSLSKLEIGEMIPPQLYDVVAEILVFVDKMDRIRQKVKAYEEQ